MTTGRINQVTIIKKENIEKNKFLFIIPSFYGVFPVV